MAKQAVDKKTREIPLTREWDVITTARKNLEAVGKMLDKYLDQYNKLLQRKDELEAQGVDYAGTWMKDNKFLYLVYPDKGNGRKRVYIGADQEKQREALDRLERGRELESVKSEMTKLSGRVGNADYYLRHINGRW
jgi:hypothetical protein